MFEQIDELASEKADMVNDLMKQKGTKSKHTRAMTQMESHAY